MTLSRDPEDKVYRDLMGNRIKDFSNTAEHHQAMNERAREDAAEELGLYWHNLDRAAKLMGAIEAKLDTWGLRPFDGDGRDILNLVADTIRASNSRKAE